MNITKEMSGENTATLKVEVREEDYASTVKKKLNEYQRSAKLPGFRPGKVPFGYIKKMYGNAVMADEINKLVSESISEFMRKNNINLLGNILSNEEKTGEVNWLEQKDFDLYFDIGLMPEFELQFSDAVTIDYYKIKAGKDELENALEEIKSQFGEYVSVEESEEKDFVTGKVQQLDADGSVPEAGISNSTYILPSSIKNEHKSLFIGIKKDESVDFDLRSVFTEDKDAARLLKVKEEELDDAAGKYRFTVEEIERHVPAQLNEDLFKKVFPNEENIDEPRFMELLQLHLDGRYTPKSDSKFGKEAFAKLQELHDFSFPEEFLKRWMLQTDNRIGAHNVDEEYQKLVPGLKSDLIVKKIVNQFNISVSEAEIRNTFAYYMNMQLGGQFPADDPRLNEIIDKMMQRQEDVERIENDILNGKLVQLMKHTLKLNITEVSNTEFDEMQKAAGEHHEHVHDENCNHDHDEGHVHDENCGHDYEGGHVHDENCGHDYEGGHVHDENCNHDHDHEHQH